MPGTSRMPVSLRDSFNNARIRARARPVWSNPLQLLSIDLYDTCPFEPRRSPSPRPSLTFLFRSIRQIVFILFVLRWTRKALWKLKGRGLLGSIVELYTDTYRVLYGYFLRMPGVRNTVRKQVDEALAKMSTKLVPGNTTRYLTLPEEGWTEEAVRKELDTLANMDHTRWEDGYVSGAVYHGEQDLMRLQTEAYGKFTVANPIHPDVFPGVRKMEAEIVSMVLNLFNAPPGAAGTCTIGGTESILMACLAARQKAYAERGVTEPEMYSHLGFRPY